MPDPIFQTIDTLRQLHVPELLAILSGLLVLIDYFYPTDWPAHVGYVLFSGAMFFVAYMYGLPLLWCAAVAVVVWLLLELLHRFFFRTFLENAPGTEAGDRVAEPQEPA